MTKVLIILTKVSPHMVSTVHTVGDDDVTLGDCDDAIMVTYVTMVQYGVG